MTPIVFAGGLEWLNRKVMAACEPTMLRSLFSKDNCKLQFAEIKCKLFLVAIFLSYIYILTEKNKIVFVK
jgi:uncharacterized protein YqhQ